MQAMVIPGEEGRMGSLGDCMVGVSDVLSMNSSVKYEVFVNRDLTTEWVVFTDRDDERTKLREMGEMKQNYILHTFGFFMIYDNKQ